MSALPYRAVLFDFGGVLTTSPFHAMRRWAADEGHDLDAVLDLFIGPDEDGDHPFHRAERGEGDFRDFREQLAGRAAALGIDMSRFGPAPVMEVRPEVIELVRTVGDAGFRTAMVSNAMMGMGSMMRSLAPVDELFDVVIESAQVGMRKPGPGIYKLALDLLGGPEGPVASEQAIFLDDRAGHIRGAEAVGIRSIFVDDDPGPALAELRCLLGLAAQ